MPKMCFCVSIDVTFKSIAISFHIECKNIYLARHATFLEGVIKCLNLNLNRFTIQYIPPSTYLSKQPARQLENTVTKQQFKTDKHHIRIQ